MFYEDAHNRVGSVGGFIWDTEDWNGGVVLSKVDLGVSSERKAILSQGDLNLYEVGELNDADRLYYAEVKLGRNLNDVEKQAVLDMHYMEEGEGYMRIVNKVRLREGRLSVDDTRVLIENGITGIQRNAGNQGYGGGLVKSAMALDIHNAEAQRVMNSIYFREYGYDPSTFQLQEFMRQYHDTGEMSVMISDYYVDQVRNNKGKLIEASRHIFVQENPGVNPGKSQILNWINSQNEYKLRGVIIDYLNEGYWWKKIGYFAQSFK